MRFRVLGPLRVWDGAAWSQIPARRQRLVLAVLLAEAGRVVTLERLVDEVWGDRPPRTAAVVVRGYVLRLRRMLPGGQDGSVVTRGHGYELLVADEDLDARMFEQQVANGRASLAEGRVEAAAEHLSQALAMWRGPAMADVPASPTVTAQAVRWEQSRVDAVEARLGVLLDLGRHNEVVGEAGRQLDDHPLRERLYEQLMLALYRQGRRGEALDVYRRAHRVLVADLGLEPGLSLRELHAAILADEAWLAASAAPGPPVVARVVAAQLPADVAGFTGRETQLRELDAARPSSGRQGSALVISTISGPAGVGKTALAVHWAHRAREEFPDGQLYVNLRGYAAGSPRRSIDALAMLLTSLRVPPERVPTDVDQAAALYRSLLADRRMLVLLDDARDPDQVRPLLPASPGCLVVVTSRDQLVGLVAREGAARLSVDVLTVVEASTLLARLLGAQRTHAEPDAAAELARLCGYLPLALRIAAANLTAHPHASIGDYTKQLAAADRLDGLEVDGDRHSGVRAAFDHSYAALPADHRRMFRLLGLVPGPDITAPAAAALANVDAATAAQMLDRLAGAHLVNELSAGRRSLHDLIRHYAAERAAAEEGPRQRLTALTRLFDHYLRGVDAAAALLYPHLLRLPTAGPATADFEDHAHALAWLDSERPNLVATVHHAAVDGPREAAWRLADALRGYLRARMHTNDWQAVADAGLAAACADANPGAQAAAHVSLAMLDFVHSRHEQAATHYSAALVLARRAAWAHGESAILGNLGVLHWRAGELQEAIDYYDQALVMDRQAGRAGGEATNLANLGLAHGALGRLEQAAAHHTQSVDLHHKTGSRSGECHSLSYLGETWHELGRLDDALSILTQARLLARAVGDLTVEADTTRFLAAVHRDAGRDAEAVTLAGGALEITRDIADSRLFIQALTTNASVHHHIGNHEKAIQDYQQALDLIHDSTGRYTQTQALIGLAGAYHHTGHSKQAIDRAEAGLTIARQAGYRLLEGNALSALAAIHLDRAEPQRAMKHAQDALTIHTETGHRLGQARTHLVIYRALHGAGRVHPARNHRRQAQTLFDAIGAPRAQHARAILGPRLGS